jgi:hypothetical protein
MRDMIDRPRAQRLRVLGPQHDRLRPHVGPQQRKELADSATGIEKSDDHVAEVRLRGGEQSHLLVADEAPVPSPRTLGPHRDRRFAVPLERRCRREVALRRPREHVPQERHHVLDADLAAPVEGQYDTAVRFSVGVHPLGLVQSVAPRLPHRFQIVGRH